MMTANQILTNQHRHCDTLFANAEQAVRQQDWLLAEAAFAALHNDLDSHFSLEENHLFQAFEQATGMSTGPTVVMRNEHAQMRELLEEMAKAVACEDGEGYLGHNETLLVLMQQHNMKEENILYPMCQAHVRELDQLLQQWISQNEH